MQRAARELRGNLTAFLAPTPVNIAITANVGQSLLRRRLEVQRSEPNVGQRRRQLGAGGGGMQVDVNVTFPTAAQQPSSLAAATAFSTALQSTPSAVLAGFEAGWGATTVAGVSLSFVESGAASAPPPPSSSAPATSSGSGSLGAFIGIAVAAVIGCSLLSGAWALPPPLSGPNLAACDMGLVVAKLNTQQWCRCSDHRTQAWLGRSHCMVPTRHKLVSGEQHPHCSPLHVQCHALLA